MGTQQTKKLPEESRDEFWSLLTFTLAYTHSLCTKESIAERRYKRFTVFCLIIPVSDFKNKISQRRQSSRNKVIDKRVKKYPHEGEWKEKWEFEKRQRRLDLNIYVPCYSCTKFQGLKCPQRVRMKRV